MNQNPNIPQEQPDPGAAQAAINAAEQVLRNSQDRPNTPLPDHAFDPTEALFEATETALSEGRDAIARDLGREALQTASKVLGPLDKRLRAEGARQSPLRDQTHRAMKRGLGGAATTGSRFTRRFGGGRPQSRAISADRSQQPPQPEA